jgi:hypothetical protein
MSQDQSVYGGESNYSHHAAQELRALLESAGLSMTAAAKILDISERAFRSLCTGKEHVPASILYALRWIAERRPNTERWLQVHWQKAGISVVRGMQFELSRDGKRISICLRGGERLIDDDIDNLRRHGVVSIHTSYSCDRLRLPELIDHVVNSSPNREELPPGSIYLMVPNGRPLSEYSLAISGADVARNYLRRRELEGRPHEIWLATRTLL